MTVVLYRRANGRVADIGPDADAIRPARGGVDVVADPFLIDVVARVACANVPDRTRLECRPRLRGAVRADRRTSEDTVVPPGREHVPSAPWIEQGLVDDVHPAPIGGDRRCRVDRAVAGERDRRRRAPVVTAVRRVREERRLVVLPEASVVPG